MDFTALAAEDDFRWGVRSFHEGSFNEAIRSFERSLTAAPEVSLTREWLGNAYFRSGFTDIALSLWEELDSEGKAGAVLQNRLNILSGRHGLGAELAPESRFVTAARIHGKAEDYSLFSRPASLLAEPSGGFYLSAFGSNEILVFNANGGLENRLRGGVDGFNRPFDIYRAENGYLYVTEYGADRVVRCTPSGTDIFRFGEKGLGEGQFIGPQFISGDGEGFIYVSDLGNRRVCKFDLAGNFILTFGKAAPGFSGFREPGGIVASGHRVYVTDTKQKMILEFDDSGNYIASHGEGLFQAPEGLSLLEEGLFLVADGDRVVSYSLDREQTAVLSDEISGTAKYIRAVRDANGNLVASDFDANRVVVFSELTNLYSGLYIQVDRIDATAFPDIRVDVKVQDRLGNPLIGLDALNFALTEDRYPVKELSLSGQPEKLPADIAVLLSGSPALQTRREDIRKAVADIFSALPEESVAWILHSDENPRVLYRSGEGSALLRERLDTARFSGNWNFDLAVRAAASEVLAGRGNKAVFFLTDGTLPAKAFETYTLIDLEYYLKNNGIAFYSVVLNSGAPPAEELLYLARQTGGEAVHLYRPEGIGAVISGLSEKKTGIYTLEYRSQNDGGFGKTYIPLEVQTYFFTRSGRERSGYYAPIEF